MLQSNEDRAVPAVVWRFRDGRAGHENQVLGLSEAIARIVKVQIFDICINRGFRGLRSLLPNQLSFARNLPKPDLLIGAGHATHLPLLSFQQRFGGKTVVIMKPSLPVAFFDLCLIPQHDTLYFPARNVIRTEGALNRVRPSNRHDADRGLILIGGPSRHFLWSDEKVARQVRTIVSSNNIQWTVSASERTPRSFLRHVQAELPDVGLMTPANTSPDWLTGQLERTGTVWVTCDSISMIYEGLTAGARVGLLELEPTAPGRIWSNIQRLIRASIVTASSDWSSGIALRASSKSLSEADRCSHIVVKRCLSQNSLSTAGFRVVELSLVAASGDTMNTRLSGPGNLISENRIPR